MAEHGDVVRTSVALKRRSRFVTVEPLVFLISAVQGGLVALRTLYIENRLALSYNYTMPTNQGNSSCYVNVTVDPTEAKIESQTAIWVAVMKGISDFLPLFVGLVYGAASDFVGRKPFLIVSASAHLAASGLFLCVAWFNLPLVCLVFGEVILGVCGDSVVFSSITYAYVSDIYAGKQRSFRIFLLETILYIGFGGSQIAYTAILQATDSNFTIAFLAIMLTALVGFLYVITPQVVLEPVVRRPFPRGVFKDLFSQIWLLFQKNTNGRRTRIALLFANMALYNLVYEAIYSVITIYGIGPPFCWNETFVGLFAFICNVIPSVVSLVVMKLLGICISEYWMIYIGFLSGIGSMVTTSLATTTPLLAYGASVVGILRVLPTPLLKYLAVQQVTNDEQGALFGAIAVNTVIGNSLSPVLMNGIYSSTVNQGHPTVAFNVAAGILAIPLIINGYLHVTQNRQQDYQPLNSNEEDKTAFG